MAQLLTLLPINRKLIGTNSFNKGLLASGRQISTGRDFESARDSEGHGTHLVLATSAMPEQLEAQP